MWEVTVSNNVVGIYESYEAAYFYATINFGYGLWTITRTD